VAVRFPDVYFRKKTSGARAYLQIVESRREAAVRQQVVATLGIYYLGLRFVSLAASFGATFWGGKNHFKSLLKYRRPTRSLFLTRLLDDEGADEVLGDLEEVYRKDRIQRGGLYARRQDIVELWRFSRHHLWRVALRKSTEPTSRHHGRNRSPVSPVGLVRAVLATHCPGVASPFSSVVPVGVGGWRLSAQPAKQRALTGVGWVILGRGPFLQSTRRAAAAKGAVPARPRAHRAARAAA
jgi:hypothetical protein